MSQSLRVIVVLVMVLILTRSSSGSRPPPLCPVFSRCVQKTVVYASRVPEVEFCKVRYVLVHPMDYLGALGACQYTCDV